MRSVDPLEVTQAGLVEPLDTAHAWDVPLAVAATSHCPSVPSWGPGGWSSRGPGFGQRGLAAPPSDFSPAVW